jgi:hypothetical protein
VPCTFTASLADPPYPERRFAMLAVQFNYVAELELKSICPAKSYAVQGNVEGTGEQIKGLPVSTTSGQTHSQHHFDPIALASVHKHSERWRTPYRVYIGMECGNLRRQNTKVTVVDESYLTVA